MTKGKRLRLQMQNLPFEYFLSTVVQQLGNEPVVRERNRELKNWMKMDERFRRHTRSFGSHIKIKENTSIFSKGNPYKKYSRQFIIHKFITNNYTAVEFGIHMM